MHGSGGPRPGGGSQVHGGPRAAVAERLTRARARGRSGEWKLTSAGGKGKGSPEGSYRGRRGQHGGGVRPTMRSSASGS
jgi:hypothetical protein